MTRRVGLRAHLAERRTERRLSRPSLALRASRRVRHRPERTQLTERRVQLGPSVAQIVPQSTAEPLMARPRSVVLSAQRRHLRLALIQLCARRIERLPRAGQLVSRRGELDVYSARRIELLGSAHLRLHCGGGRCAGLGHLLCPSLRDGDGRSALRQRRVVLSAEYLSLDLSLGRD